MKYIFVIFFSFIAFSNSVSASDDVKEKHPLKDTVKLDDAEIRKMMVGPWVVPPGDIDYSEDRGGISVYKDDGSYIYVEFETNRCEKATFSIEAKWRIEEGKLVIERSSFFDSVMGSDFKIVDRVISIDGKVATLQSEETTQTFRRVKSRQCLI